VQVLLSHLQNEYVLNFLMGLSDSFSLVRGQILQTIYDAFSLVVQEEKQKVGTIHTSADAQLAFDVQYASGLKGKTGKKDRPCVHCGVLGHTKDKCFKLNVHDTRNGNLIKLWQISLLQFLHPMVNKLQQQYQQMLPFVQVQMARSITMDVDQMNSWSLFMTV
jgi:hypothetical protein